MTVSHCFSCDLSYKDFCLTYCGKSDLLIDVLITHGVLPTPLDCPKCHRPCRLDYNRKDYRCDRSYTPGKRKKQRCEYVRTIFTGTWLDHVKVDIETNITFINIYLRNNFTYQNARDELDLSDNTICNWTSFCREVLINWCLENTRVIGGPGNIVEIDESKFGSRKYHVGRVIEGQWVFGGFCRQTKQLFLVPVEKRDAKTLIRVLKEHVLPGTTIMSDMWKGYKNLSKAGFEHFTVNHSLNFVDPVTGAHTNTIERKWRDAKRAVPQFGRRKAHFIGYLARVIFIKKYPQQNKRLHHFLLAVATLYPPDF